MRIDYTNSARNFSRCSCRPHPHRHTPNLAGTPAPSNAATAQTRKELHLAGMVHEEKMIANPDYIAEHAQAARDVAATVNCKVCDEFTVVVGWTSLVLVALCM